jgi:phosphatidylinositol glycan class M
VPRLQQTLSWRKTTGLVLAWVLAQALWLVEAYKLEFLGENVFFTLWTRGLVYLVLNAVTLGEIVKAYAAVPAAVPVPAAVLAPTS